MAHSAQVTGATMVRDPPSRLSSLLAPVCLIPSHGRKRFLERTAPPVVPPESRQRFGAAEGSRPGPRRCGARRKSCGSLGGWESVYSGGESGCGHTDSEPQPTSQAGTVAAAGQCLSISRCPKQEPNISSSNLYANIARSV